MNGDKYKCSNSSGISLLSVAGKVYGRVLIKKLGLELKVQYARSNLGLDRVEPSIEHGSSVCQSQVCKKYLANEKDVFWVFVDLKEVYEMIDRHGMWQMLRVYGVGGKLWKAVNRFYVDSKTRVRAWVCVYGRGCVRAVSMVV